MIFDMGEVTSVMAKLWHMIFFVFFGKREFFSRECHDNSSNAGKAQLSLAWFQHQWDDGISFMQTLIDEEPQ